MLQLTFNPGLTLTAFRTTRPRAVFSLTINGIRYGVYIGFQILRLILFCYISKLLSKTPRGLNYFLTLFLFQWFRNEKFPVNLPAPDISTPKVMTPSPRSANYQEWSPSPWDARTLKNECFYTRLSCYFLTFPCIVLFHKISIPLPQKVFQLEPPILLEILF